MNNNQNKPTPKTSTTFNGITIVPVLKEEIDTEKLAKALIMFQEHQQREEEKLKHSPENKKV